MNRLENEFSLLPKDAVVLEFKDEIIALVDKFNKSWQSWWSAPYYAKIIAQCVEKLCLQKPLWLITWDSKEWFKREDWSFQNNRDSAIFKKGENWQPFYLNAISWRNQTWGYYYWTAISQEWKDITSRQYIKQFPFKPKTFYIDVIEEEIQPWCFEFYIRNDNDLKDVFEYYDKFK